MNKFFDDLGKKTKNFFHKAPDLVETGCERFQLAQDIRAVKNALNELFIELGRLSYHGNAELAGVRSRQAIVDDISAAAAKLEALENELEEILSPKEEPDISLKEEPVASCFCHKCGHPQPDENDFCHKCGAKLNR